MAGAACLSGACSLVVSFGFCGAGTTGTATGCTFFGCAPMAGFLVTAGAMLIGFVSRVGTVHCGSYFFLYLTKAL